MNFKKTLSQTSTLVSAALMMLSFSAHAENHADQQADLEAGKSIYDSKCAVCHSRGIAGAPKLTDTAKWETRLEKGMETVVANAINGINGMPPKGGHANLTEEEVTNAVKYMVSEATKSE